MDRIKAFFLVIKLFFLGWWLNIKSAWAYTIAIPGRVFRAIKRSPFAAYRKVASWRDWLIAKVEYLNSESAKWKRTFNILKSPYSFLRMMGLSPQMAIGLLAVGSTAGTGVVVNETILAERSFSNGDSGVYAAPADIPTSFSDENNTLRIDLGIIPVREITIENVSVGTVFTGSTLPTGHNNVVQISGLALSATSTRLEVGHLIFEKSRCKQLLVSDVTAHTLIVKHNSSDGQSIAPSPGTGRMRAIGGGHHQAEEMKTSGGTYDRLVISARTSGVNGKVDTLRLSNLYTKGGNCVLNRMDIGTLEINLNEVGEGNGFATKEFVIATSTTASVMSISDNVEVTIAEPDTQ